MIFSNRPSLFQSCTPIPGLSDHIAVLAITQVISPRQKPRKRKIFLWNRADKNLLKETVQKFSEDFFNKANQTSSVQELWEYFLKGMLKIMDEIIPNKWTNPQFTQPWANSAIKRLSRSQKKALRRYRKTGNPQDLEKLKKLQKLQRQTCRKAYSDYIMGIIDPENDLNSKRLFSCIKSLRQDNSNVGPLYDTKGVLQSDPTAQAELLNAQFASVFTKEDLQNVPKSESLEFPDMPKITFNANGVRKLLKNLKMHKATGPDQLPARFLIETADETSPMLATIFQLSYDQSVVPSDWLSANIVPVFKKETDLVQRTIDQFL